jgi:hypothetical protein
MRFAYWPYRFDRPICARLAPPLRFALDCEWTLWNVDPDAPSWPPCLLFALVFVLWARSITRIGDATKRTDKLDKRITQLWGSSGEDGVGTSRIALAISVHQPPHQRPTILHACPQVLFRHVLLPCPASNEPHGFQRFEDAGVFGPVGRNNTAPEWFCRWDEHHPHWQTFAHVVVKIQVVLLDIHRPARDGSVT